MRTLFAPLTFLIFVSLSACSPSTETDAAAIEAVDNAVAKLDEAFETQNAAAIKGLMTPGHLAVTHYYETPQTVDEQIASLPALKYEQTNLSEPKVVLLTDGVAMRTVTAKLEGSFQGKPISGDVFITSIMIEQDGEWREHFYQVTHIAP